MANTNVNEYNYNYAHECYIAYYTGDQTDTTKYNNGKLVAESEKWKSYVIKWQSEDSTTYDVDDYKSDKMEGVDKDSGKEQKGVGGITTGAVAGAGGIAVALLAKNLKFVGNIVTAGVYAALGIIFLGMALSFTNKAKESRTKQEQYINQTTPFVEYDFNQALGKAGQLNEMIIGYQTAAYELTQQAGTEVNLSNNVSNVMTGANNPMAFAAMGSADATAGETSDELEGINSEILSMCAEYDAIITEVNGQKAISEEVKNISAEHSKNRKANNNAMIGLAAGGAAAAACGLLGAFLAYQSNGFVTFLAIAAIALYVVGAALFGIGAFSAFKEQTQQKTGMQAADQQVDLATTSVENGTSASSDIGSFQAESNASYQSTLDMQEQMNDENANYTGEAV